MASIPLLVVGDGPQEPTGLGRIARDLCGLIAKSDLGLDLVQVGGTIPPVWQDWRHLPLDPSNEDWGAEQVRQYWLSLWGDRPGILWVIWDPSRLFAYQDLQLPVQKWAYTAIDAVNIWGAIGGPAQEALRSFDRVLAYGRWASHAVRLLRQEAPYLPHGLNTSAYSQEVSAEEDAWVTRTLGPFLRSSSLLVGAVGTNQPRKDWGLYFWTLSELKKRGHNVYGWVHTDQLVKAWAIPQLVADFSLQKQVTITQDLTDRQLALMYRACDVTIGMGLGEGFGYCLVESLAAGVPVVHGGSGGGAELLPRAEWRPPIREERLESVYGLRRPVYRATDFANAVEEVLRWREAVGERVVQAYCRGSVQHLEWSILWPRWRSWIRQGL
jgi:glycosyltransferase involved in cell wall biosynthesis